MMSKVEGRGPIDPPHPPPPMPSCDFFYFMPSGVKELTATHKDNKKQFEPKKYQPNTHHQPADKEMKRNFVLLLYNKGISERITNMLGKHSVKMTHKHVRTVGSFFKRPKGSQMKERTRRIVYKIGQNWPDILCLKNKNTRILESRHYL